MVAQKDDTAWVIIARAYDFAQPANLFRPKRTGWSNEIFQKGPTDGIIGRVQSYDAPIFVFQAEEASLLAAWLPMRHQTKCRQDAVEIGKAARIHFMVAVQCKTSMQSSWPKARLITVSWVLDSEKVFIDLVRGTYVIHIA